MRRPVRLVSPSGAGAGAASPAAGPAAGGGRRQRGGVAEHGAGRSEAGGVAETKRPIEVGDAPRPVRRPRLRHRASSSEPRVQSPPPVPPTSNQAFLVLYAAPSASRICQGVCMK